MKDDGSVFCLTILLALSLLCLCCSASAHGGGTDPLGGLRLSPAFDHILHQTATVRDFLPSLVLDYGVFRGRSSLRNLTLEDWSLLDNISYPELKASKSLLSLFLLIRNRGDAAHEVLLGVNRNNLEEAEWAATHPGSGWSKRHPLSDTDDMVHSLIHRLEGDSVGEGNHTGFENAKYWAAGGPKRHDVIPATNNRDDHEYHPVYRHLARLATKLTPHAQAAGVVASDIATTKHDIVADGGGRRTVCVRAGCWDPIRFIDLLSKQKYHSNSILLLEELNTLQEKEIRLLIRYELLRLSGLSSQDIDAKFIIDVE